MSSAAAPTDVSIEDGTVVHTNIIQHSNGGQSVKIDYQTVRLSNGCSFSVNDYVWWFPLQRGEPIRALGKLLQISRRISASARSRDTCVIQWLYNRENLVAEFHYDLSQGELPDDHYIYTNFKCLADTKVDILDCQASDVKIYQNLYLKYDQLIHCCSSTLKDIESSNINQKRKLLLENNDIVQPKKHTNDISIITTTQGAELLRNRVSSRYWRTHIVPMIKECPARQQALYKKYFLDQLDQFVQPEFTKEQCDLLFQPVLLPSDYKLRLPCFVLNTRQTGVAA